MYTLVYQLITIMFPLILVPYISRVLGSGGVGTYAFTASIGQYFILFGMLGLGVYGSKHIAESRDNKKSLSETFLSIYGLQLMMTTLSIVIYFIFIRYGAFQHEKIMLIQGIALLSCLVDCSWFFSGLEKFKKIVISNSIIKVISFISVLMLVKSEDDLIIYTIIMTASTILGQLVLWLGINKYIRLVPIKLTQILQHFKPTLIYFIPQIAIQIYFVLNKTMIGIFSTESEVGIFDYSDKLLKVSLAFVTSLGTIMLPRMAYVFNNGDIEKGRSYLSTSLNFSSLLAVPIMFGMAGISLEFIPWYLGEDFNKSIYVLIIISPTILFMSWSGVFGTQYLLPLGKMKIYTICVYIGAIVNLILNLFLIKPYGAIGASIGTLFAEFFVMFTQLLFIRKQIATKKIFFKTIDYVIAGFIMLVVIRIVGYYLGSGIVTTLIQIIAGGTTYLLLTIAIEYMKKEGLILDELRKIKWLQNTLKNFNQKIKHFES